MIKTVCRKFQRRNLLYCGFRHIYIITKYNFFIGGADAGGWEEYFDYIFPEDEGAKPNLKLLAMAKMWKKQKETAPEEKENSENEEEEEERIPIAEEIPEMSNDDPNADQNLDADDEDIKNESSDSEESSESEDENDEPKAKRKKE